MVGDAVVRDLNISLSNAHRLVPHNINKNVAHSSVKQKRIIKTSSSLKRTRRQRSKNNAYEEETTTIINVTVKKASGSGGDGVMVMA